jgi:hypothetical protein
VTTSIEVKEHQAIIFYGSSPGTGKSSLSSFLFEQLSLHKIPVRWVYEDDVLHIPYFADFVADILSGNPTMLETLRQATRGLVQESLSANAVAITDSIYPCINWLFSTALYSRQELLDFGVELEQLLAPLNPLVVFLNADPKVALQRAIDQRGEAWFEGLLAVMNGYSMNREHPLQNLGEAAAYFRVQAELSLEVLRRWSFNLLLIDAMQTPLAEAKSMILGQLGLAEIEGSPSLAVDEMARYVGRYQAEGSVPITNPLIISMQEGKLWVNEYWPNGCPLLAKGDSHFRLENTSYRIHFDRGPDEEVVSIHYSMGDNHYRFVKVE